MIRFGVHRRAGPWLRAFVPPTRWWFLPAQYLIVFLYLCLPRAILTVLAPHAELALSRGFLDRRLAYTAVLLAAFHLLRVAAPRGARWLLHGWLHAEFLAGSLEAAVFYQFGIGYSPLFFFHAQAESVRVALSSQWPLIAGALVALMLVDWALRRFPPGPWFDTRARALTAFAIVMLFGVRSGVVLLRHGVLSEFEPVAMSRYWKVTLDEKELWSKVAVSPVERQFVDALNIDAQPTHTVRATPARPRNLITIYLEGFQANFTAAGGSRFPGLTPNLDRFAARAVRFDQFYNAVTPTINALISSQCGILSEVENAEFSDELGYTRNLQCLPDVLHKAGYHQVYMGGADSGFSGKRAFLRAHQFDEVLGWEEWSHYGVDEAHRNEWGLLDMGLVDEAMARLPDIAFHAPFHLSLLTLDTHPPGVSEPGCPVYDESNTLLNAIHCTDFAMGRLFDFLERGGYLRNTAVVVMGDHMMFPSAENRAALGPSQDSWFGHVYMAVAYPDSTPRVISSASYTPDLASIALDALGFRPVPEFPFGRSPLSGPDTRSMLVAPRFQVVDGHLNPPNPDPTEHCASDDILHTTIDPRDGLSACEREKVLLLSEQFLQQQ